MNRQGESLGNNKQPSSKHNRGACRVANKSSFYKSKQGRREEAEEEGGGGEGVPQNLPAT